MSAQGFRLTPEWPLLGEIGKPSTKEAVKDRLRGRARCEDELMTSATGEATPQLPYRFDLDEETNALDYLRRAIGFLREVEAGDAVAWKWVVIALHGALYGFAVSAARGTDGNSVTHLTKKGERKLDSFDEVLKKCQNPTRMKMTVDAKHLVLTAEQKEAIRMLKDTLRNVFEHFVPMGWVLHVQGLPRISYRVLEVIRFLALETNPYVHLDPDERSELESLVTEGFGICERVRKVYLPS